MGETNAIDLNQFDLLGRIICPYCNKVMVYSYGAKGRSSRIFTTRKTIPQRTHTVSSGISLPLERNMHFYA